MVRARAQSSTVRLQAMSRRGIPEVDPGRQDEHVVPRRNRELKLAPAVSLFSSESGAILCAPCSIFNMCSASTGRLAISAAPFEPHEAANVAG